MKNSPLPSVNVNRPSAPTVAVHVGNTEPPGSTVTTCAAYTVPATGSTGVLEAPPTICRTPCTLSFVNPQAFTSAVANEGDGAVAAGVVDVGAVVVGADTEDRAD